ncbi:MAG: GNAT family N-acetyltransferase [Acidobacteria bacterium]|nr:GNAT family N-acetyltransferase [Acidobacteriota bacterium]
MASSTVIPMPLRMPLRVPDWQPPAKCQFAVERQPMSITIVRSAAELAEHQTAWEDLARHAIEANVFYEPWMFLPEWELLGRSEDLRCVLIYTTGPSNEGSPKLLAGFFPLERARGYKGLPVTYTQLWRTPHISLCTPLIRADYARDCLNAFFDWVGEASESGSLLALPYLSGDGLFNQLLTDYTNDCPNLFTIEERTNRALLTRSANSEDYLSLALSGKRRKELRRQEKLLRELGEVEYVEFRPGDEVEWWLEQFLSLEAHGWKGAEGSALGKHHETRELFLRTMRAAAARGRLLMLALHLNGRPIAMKCNVQAGVGAFSLKIAYDEAYASYSPGVHLELENVRRFHEHPQLQWMDSCATSRHFMINRLWTARRSLKRIVIATGKGGGNFIVAALPLLRWYKRKFKVAPPSEE